jgi:hypothetical protein
MSERVTYKRLLRQFAAIGPYLREDLCEEGRYRFDCLSVTPFAVLTALFASHNGASTML